MNAIRNATASGVTGTTEEGRMNTLLIVDASNVAFGNAGAMRTPILANLTEVLAMLTEADLEIKAIADASLRHKIDRREDYEQIIQLGRVIQAPAGRSADQFIAQLARKRKAEGQNAYILTNDLFRQCPDLEQFRVTFLMIAEREIIFDPPLETLLSTTREGTREAHRAGYTAGNTRASGSPNETIVSQQIYCRS